MKTLTKSLLATGIAAAFQASSAQLYYAGSMTDGYGSGPDSASTQAELYETGGAPGPTQAIFSDPFTFATDRPVVDLPTGWTLNSPKSGIVNDQFFATPEPPSPAILGMGLLGLFLLKRPR